MLILTIPIVFITNNYMGGKSKEAPIVINKNVTVLNPSG